MGGGMTLILSGTNGLSDVDGTAATPAIRGTDANTGMFFPAADTIAFAEGGVEAMRLDAAGNMGLGVTPSAWGSDTRALQIFNRTSLSDLQSTTQLTNNGHWNGSSWVYRDTAAAGNYFITGNTHTWRYAASGTAGATLTWSEAMRIDSSGNLLVGTTGNILSARLNVAKNNSSTLAFFSQDYSAGNADNVAFVNGFATGGNAAVQCRFYNNALSSVGTITSSGSATAYNTSSDYRLKNTIAPMTGALAKVALLKPVTYKWNADGSDSEGFIAHELAEVCPQAVAGEKDAVNAEGKPVYQGIDTSFLVATLTAAIQEQQIMIEQLKADVAALKGTV
jgi:hypothetical protein